MKAALGRVGHGRKHALIPNALLPSLSFLQCFYSSGRVTCLNTFLAFSESEMFRNHKTVFEVTLMALGRESSGSVLVVRVGRTADLEEQPQPSDVISCWYRHLLALITVQLHKAIKPIHILATLLTQEEKLQYSKLNVNSCSCQPINYPLHEEKGDSSFCGEGSPIHSSPQPLSLIPFTSEPYHFVFQVLDLIHPSAARISSETLGASRCVLGRNIVQRGLGTSQA